MNWDKSISVEEYAGWLSPFKEYLSLKTPFALMVSGGSDSIAMLWLTYQWLQQYSPNQRCIVLSVNHHLRPESTKEIQFVSSLSHNWGFQHVVLNWEGEKPVSALQEQARQARYDLIHNWCQQHNIQNVFTGHHLQDQVETFIYRLCRHSSYYGLACMAPTRSYKNIFLMRPLLQIPKERLQATLIQAKISWVEDPSNEKDQFERIKIRSFLETTPDKHALMQTISHLTLKCAVLRQFVEEKTQNFLNQPGIIDGLGYIKIPLPLLSKYPWIEIERILTDSIRLIGGRQELFRSKALKRVWEILKISSGQRTYGGCLIQSKKGFLWIFCEQSSLKKTQPLLNPIFAPLNSRWDHRFYLTFKKENLKLNYQNFLIKPLSLAGWRILPKDKKQELLKKAPLKAWLTIPVVWEGNEIVALPGLKEQKISYKTVFKPSNTRV